MISTRALNVQTTNSSGKNELLFSQFGINYNNEPEQFRKGTVLVRAPLATPGIESGHTGGLLPPVPDASSTHTSLAADTSDHTLETQTVGHSAHSTVSTHSTEIPTAKPTSEGASRVGGRGGNRKHSPPTQVLRLHCDIVRDTFWDLHPFILHPPNR